LLPAIKAETVILLEREENLSADWFETHPSTKIIPWNNGAAGVPARRKRFHPEHSGNMKKATSRSWWLKQLRKIRFG
jgi:hypothetical protein